MSISVRCRCGAEYMVEAVYLLPPRCRFCGGSEFYRATGPQKSEQRRPEPGRGPTVRGNAPAGIDRAEIMQYGGSKETLWGAIILLVCFLPRPVGDEILSGFQVLAGAAGSPSAFLSLGLPVFAATLAIVLGLALPGRLRGPAVAGAATLAILLSPGFAGMDSGRGFVITGMLTFSAMAAGFAVVIRVEDSVGGRTLLGLSGLVGLGFLTVFTFAIVGGLPSLPAEPILTLAVGATALAAALALPAATPWPSAPRAARAGRFFLWTGVFLWALRSLFFPMSGDAFYELAPLLLHGGLLGLLATGVADGILSVAAEWRRRIGERMSRESVGFLERFNRDAVYGPGRRE